MADKLRVTLRRSIVGTNPSARGTVRALGLRRIGHSVVVPDDVAVRGQLRAVRYLIDVEEVVATSHRGGSAAKRKGGAIATGTAAATDGKDVSS